MSDREISDNDFPGTKLWHCQMRHTRVDVGIASGRNRPEARASKHRELHEADSTIKLFDVEVGRRAR